MLLSEVREILSQLSLPNKTRLTIRGSWRRITVLCRNLDWAGPRRNRSGRRRKCMWLPLVAFIVCLSANAAAQCPIQVRQASLDTTGRSVTIRYYNAAPHVAYDVQFVLLSENATMRSVVGNFSARNILRPKQERTAVFPNPSGITFNSTNMELEVVQVSFRDYLRWTAPHDNICKVEFMERN